MTGLKNVNCIQENPLRIDVIISGASYTKMCFHLEGIILCRSDSDARGVNEKFLVYVSDFTFGFRKRVVHNVNGNHGPVSTWIPLFMFKDTEIYIKTRQTTYDRNSYTCTSKLVSSYWRGTRQPHWKTNRPTHLSLYKIAYRYQADDTSRAHRHCSIARSGDWKITNAVSAKLGLGLTVTLASTIAW